MKPFLRLKGTHFQAMPACCCECVDDYPLRISFIERDGLVKAYVERCVNGVQEWWPYANLINKSSLIILPS